MEQQKPRRRAKWLSKVLGRESSSQVAETNFQNDQHKAQGQSQGRGIEDGSSRKTSPKATPFQADSGDGKGHTEPSSQVPVAENDSKLQGDQDKAGVDPKERPGDVPNSIPMPAVETMKVPKPLASQVLAAPVDTSRSAANSNSPYRKEDENNTSPVPRLLDPKACMQSADLWEKAYTQLSQDTKHKDLLTKYEAILEESSPAPNPETRDSFPKKMQASVQRQVNVMKRRQWTIQWDQKSIVVREQTERIVKFIQTFSKLGTAIAQIDPVHAGIPWAGVCAILTLILNDSTQHKAALDGLEDISSLVAKYIAIEDVYVQSHQVDPKAESNDAFEASIIKVYSSILRFQVEAALHFHRPTMARTVSNIVQSVDWTGLLSKVKESDAECVAFTSMAGLATLGSNLNGIGNSLVELRQRCKEIHDIGKALATLQEAWDSNRKGISQIVSWISDAQVGEDHERVRTKLGARYWDAGQWFLENPGFKVWKESNRGQFWLQGSVGTGKTSLASIVINDLIKAGDNRCIAFYYCSRSSTGSSNDTTAIFRSLVAQLACKVDGEDVDVYPVIRQWYQRDAKRYVMGSRLSLTECEDLLVTLMAEHVRTAIVIDGLDECEEEMQLLRSLYGIWRRYPNLQVFLTSRLHVDVLEVFPKITTVQSDFGKTSKDIKEYIRKELQRKDRRNAKVITDELAERMVEILTQRAQGMFRWVELQLDLLISSERRIRYRRDFEERLLQLELGSGKEVIDALRDTYDEIYERNTSQGRHSRRLAEKSLKWVLCAARPLKIWELGAAVAVDGEDKVTTSLIVDTCSNFFNVDSKGFVQLAHLSVREYLEVKNVAGCLIFSPEEAHAEVALTCILYWKNLSQISSNDEHEDESEFNYDSQDEQNVEEVDAMSISDPRNNLIVTITKPKEDNQEYDPVQGGADRENREIVEQMKAAKTAHQKTQRLHGWVDGSQNPEPEQDNVGEKEGTEGFEQMEDNPTETLILKQVISTNTDYFSLADKYIRMDSAPALKPQQAFKRFQRYASIYWATHCQAAKGPRMDESRQLNELFWDFMDDNGSSPEYKLWEIALLNEAKLTSVPMIDPAPMIFVPATAHDQAILDAEPIYERWQETIARSEGPQPLRPNVSLIACFYGFTDILQEISEDGSAQTTRNHEGIMGLVLAARNGYNEVLDLPISNERNLDVPDRGGRTALHHAALGGYLELVRFLLGYPRKSGRRAGKKDRKSRVDVNARDLGEKTPLHYAAESDQVEVVKLLLGEENVDVHARNQYGYTALGLCSQNTSDVMAKLLRDDKRYRKEDEF
ncbi:Vegetative incompatibility protein HET-E-1 [Lachnellula hyalina]|uniref:Vegetative incompatibility protein HET-E-1 n=1 Tax=Lachnellula hyalina TaxID=1316788 RepID=A0A8H8R184_9HELO|nr:Vegetative incompatibility protein HET-E-1 [Lachnellula hyalina]TVY25039.1 Vegetative incompatibility protein HET-E-1 [Lachnellula hyalina]